MSILHRRSFLKTTATAGALCAVAPTVLAQSPAPKRPAPFVGIHIAAHSFYDEGFDHCLDFLRDTAGVNALFVASNSYYGAMFRPKEAQGDHGVPIRDGRAGARSRRCSSNRMRPSTQRRRCATERPTLRSNTRAAKSSWISPSQRANAA